MATGLRCCVYREEVGAPWPRVGAGRHASVCCAPGRCAYRSVGVLPLYCPVRFAIHTRKIHILARKFSAPSHRCPVPASLTLTLTNGNGTKGGPSLTKKPPHLNKMIPVYRSEEESRIGPNGRLGARKASRRYVANPVYSSEEESRIGPNGRSGPRKASRRYVANPVYSSEEKSRIKKSLGRRNRRVRNMWPAGNRIN